MKVNGNRLISTNLLVGNETWNALPRPVQMRDNPTGDFFLEQKPQESNMNVTRLFKISGNKSLSLGSTQILGWYNTLFNILDDNDQDKGSNVINYLGFIAGIMCRMSVKDPIAVSNHIVENTIDRFFSIFGSNPSINFTPPPNSVSCQTWSQDMRKMSPGCNQLLTILITAKVCVDPVAKNDIEGLLRAMCLLSLNAVGLGALNWASKAAELTQMELSEFLSRMCLGLYRKPAYDIYRVLVFVSENNQKTFVYARLFQEGAFIQLSTKNNPDFSMACAAISLNATELNDIWEIPQFSAYKDRVEDACKFSHIFRKLRGLSHETRRAVRSWLCLPISCPSSYIHSPTSAGGLGVSDFERFVPLNHCKRLTRLQSSPVPAVREAYLPTGKRSTRARRERWRKIF